MEFGHPLGGVLSLILTTWIATEPCHLLQMGKNPNDYIRDPLKLTLSINRESYSEISPATSNTKRPRTQLLLNLRLRFANSSNKIVKLDKGCIHLASIVVYDSPLVGPSEPLLPEGMISDKGKGCSYQTDEKLLVIPPGEFYETTNQVKFEVIDHGPFHSPESLGPGEYFLQITVTTWWQIDGQDEELREQRKRPGAQAGRYVESQLMRFVVEGRPVKRRA